MALLWPRSCGKTTLARSVGDERGYKYFTFDNAVAISAAKMHSVSHFASIPGHSNSMDMTLDVMLSLMC